MRFFSYLRSQRSLLAENERLQAENAELRYDLATAWLASWIRRPPKAACPPKSDLPVPPLPRADPHLVHAARHRLEAPTEHHPRVDRRREPSK